jgi:hypothetical protein
MGPKLATVVFAAVLAAVSSARAAELPEQRLICQEEARRSIKGPRPVDVDLYRRVFERRTVYIENCMSNAPQDVEQTGAIPMPLPPRRPIVKM